MALKPPTTREEWDELARYRTIRVLRQRVAATIRQLEVKICESGPAHIRPQPHILTRAIGQLSAEGTIRSIKPAKQQGDREETLFFTHKDNYPAAAEERIKRIFVPYRVHRMLADRNEWCSDVLEDIVRASFDANPDYAYVGQPPDDRPLDAAYLHVPSEVFLGIEVKNVREWVYPTSERLWPLLSKCAELDLVPVLVARKVSYLAKQVFRTIGVLRLEFHRQVFSPLVAHLLPDIQHVDSLGYKDVIALPSSPHTLVEHFAAQTVPAFIEEYAALWSAHREIVKDFADDHGLASTKLSSRTREAAFAEFLKAIKISPDI